MTIMEKDENGENGIMLTSRWEREETEGEVVYTPIAVLPTVLKTTDTVLVAVVSLRMMKLTIPPSLTVYIVGSNPTITTVIKK